MIEAGVKRVTHPLVALNINHTESPSAVAIQAACSLIHVHLKNVIVASSIVIQSNSISYARPIYGEFTARLFIAQP